MIEAGYSNAAQNHAGTCDTGADGQGAGSMRSAPANAATAGSNTIESNPHGKTATPPAGIIEGAKKSIAAINTVLTIFRMCLCIAAPLYPGTYTPSPE